MLILSAPLMWLAPYRQQYARTPALWLALLLALVACASLLKTQASHYFFPAAVFFNIHNYPRSVEEGKKISWFDGVEAIRVLLKYRFVG